MERDLQRYILRPRLTSVQSLSLATRSMSLARRATQWEEVQGLRREDRATAEIREWVRSVDGNLLTIGEGATPVTGATVAEISAESAEELRDQRPDVMVLRDQPLPLIDPIRPAGLAANKKALAARDLWHLSPIGLAAAREKKLAGTGEGVTVAVLDTGIDAAHPELAGRVGGAFTFDTAAWEARPIDPSRDTEGHGTHVAGLICGKQVGTAPGAKVLSGVMIPNGMGRLSDFVLALEWAASRPDVQIVNLSAGIRGWVDGMQAILSDLLLVGVLPVVAVGNEGRDRTRSPGNYPGVLSVGAVDGGSRVVPFSSGGRIDSNHHVYYVPNVVAPGKGVFSCVRGGGYEAWDGTSMATPIVAGVAALILERYKDQEISVTDLQDAILTTCQNLGQPEDRQGHGLVQVRGALADEPKPAKAATAKARAPAAGRRKAPPPSAGPRGGKGVADSKTVKGKGKPAGKGRKPGG